MVVSTRHLDRGWWAQRLPSHTPFTITLRHPPDCPLLLLSGGCSFLGSPRLWQGAWRVEERSLVAGELPPGLRVVAHGLQNTPNLALDV